MPCGLLKKLQGGGNRAAYFLRTFRSMSEVNEVSIFKRFREIWNIQELEARNRWKVLRYLGFYFEPSRISHYTFVISWYIVSWYIRNLALDCSG